MALFRSPAGALAPPGVISSQKKVWFQWPPRLLRTGVRTASGTADRLERISSGGLVARSGYFSTRPLRLVMKALWWFLWWKLIVAVSMCGSSAS